MKILFEVHEIAQAKGGPHGVCQRVTLEPRPDPGDETVDGYASRQLQVVITNPGDFLESTTPGEILSISLRPYETVEEGE